MKFLKKAMCSVVMLTMILSSAMVPGAFAAYDSKTSVLAAGELEVVNYTPVWGDVDANVTAMTGIIRSAAASGVKIIVFPAMATTGYMGENDEALAYELAEPSNGETEAAFAALADSLNMWIIYGGIESGNDCIYNAQFACSPDGDTSVYEEIAPTNDMFTPGDYPVIIHTEWGNMGLMVGNDCLNLPEVERYYAAKDAENYQGVYSSDGLGSNGIGGCGVILMSLAYNEYYDADTGDSEATEWIMGNRFISAASRDGVLIAAANQAGEQDDESFPGGSIILSGVFTGFTCYGGGQQDTIAGSTDSDDPDHAIPTYNSYCIGEEKFTAEVVSTAEINLDNFPGSTVMVTNDFKPDVYAEQYYELAEKQAAGESFDYTIDEHGGPIVATVNTNGVWGDKKATLEIMTSYIDEVAAMDSDDRPDIMVFPETFLTGYEYHKDDMNYKDYNPLTGNETVYSADGADGTVAATMDMHVALAETVHGSTTQYILNYAKSLGLDDMYIVFGFCEVPESGPMTESYYGRLGVGEDTLKCWNSIAIIDTSKEASDPDYAVSYQKEHRAGSECYWSVCGTEPLFYDFEVDGIEWTAGSHICRDGHFYPEEGRYYVMSGAQMLLHPTATTGNALYRETRMGSYCSRDNVAVITVNVWGPDGLYSGDAEDPWYDLENWSGGYFHSTSLIMTPDYLGDGEHDDNKHPIEMYGTGTDSESPEGLEFSRDSDGNITNIDLYGCGFQTGNLNYLTLAKMYDELALCMVDSYESLFTDESIVLNIDSTEATVRGEAVTSDVAPTIVNGSTMGSVRFIAEGLGAKVSWDKATNSVTIVTAEAEIKLVIDSTTAYVDGEAIEIGSAPYVTNNRTFLPVQYITELLGATVVYHSSGSTVTIIPEYAQ